MAGDTIKTRASQQRLRGAFNTPSLAANFMATWILKSNPHTVLEPCFGEGTFLHALSDASIDLQCTPPSVIGVEIDKKAFARATASGIPQLSRAILDDFLHVEPFEVDAVIGNPPYVRLRHMESSESAVAMEAAAVQLGFEMDPSGSVWMPFVAHSVAFVRQGGQLALVLPLDATYVRYAWPLWEYLASQFGELQVIRSQERVFPEILQDVVILMASNKGASCNTVRYQAYSQVTNFLTESPEVEAEIPITDIVNGRKPFIWAHVSAELRLLLEETVASNLVHTQNLARFNIGYVAGDKSFFHPSKEAQSNFGLREKSLRQALSSSRSLRRAGLYTSGMPGHAIDSLFLPTQGESEVEESDLAYIKHGELLGIDQRYKCRVRSPWYIVPYVKTPDVVLTVFSERPILAVNDARFVASNSLLCGYLNGIDARDFAARWYTSLTLLHIETEVHSLGGGVMVLVPRETGNIRIANPKDILESRLAEVNRRLSTGDVEGAYRVGDEVVLKEALGLTDTDLDLVYEGIATLTRWRTSARTLNGSHN